MAKTSNSEVGDVVKEEIVENVEVQQDSSSSAGLPKHKWAITTYVLGIVCIVLIILLLTGNTGLTGNVVKTDDMKTRITSFVNTELVPEGGVVVKDLKKESGLYVATITANGQDVPLYFTLDGKFISPGRPLYTLEVLSNTTNSSIGVERNVTKTDKPKVELFVMTYCPYGTQAEKGLLPVMELLKSKADFKIRFVHYFMHGDKEEQETYTQVCIREEQPDKFNSYLSCFLEASDSSNCITKTGVDKSKVDSCISSGKAKTYYEADSQYSKAYEVQGSPTLIINGVQVEFYPRSPANALSEVCSAFKTAPSQCSQQLSNVNPAPGFGTGAATASDTSASCA